MNCKLTQADREQIRSMLGSWTHEEIARRFGVCTRTVDREAAWLEAHSVTFRKASLLSGGHITGIRIGEAVQVTDAELQRMREDADRMFDYMQSEEFKREMAAIEAEADRFIAQADTEEFKREMAAIEAEASRIMDAMQSEPFDMGAMPEAFGIGLRGCPTIDEPRARGTVAPPEAFARQKAVPGPPRPSLEFSEFLDTFRGPSDIWRSVPHDAMTSACPDRPIS